MQRTEDKALGLIDGDDDEFPNTAVFANEVAYNMTIHAISSEIDQRQLGSEKNLKMAMQAAAILKNMEERYESSKREEVKPTTISYSTVLKAWANAGKAVEAENILNKMIKFTEDPNLGTAKPNLICFNTVIGGWAKTKGRGSADRALHILKQMEKLSNMKDFSDVSPDTITYSTVISAFARSGREDAGDRAEELLQRSLSLFDAGQQHLKPDTMTFCSVLNALSKQNRTKQQNREQSSLELERAEKVFERMKKMHEDGDTSIRPNIVAYNIILGMYVDSMRADKAELLFNEFCAKYEDGDLQMKPDIISYNHFLFALANSTSRNNVEKAIALLSKMEKKINGVKEDDILVEPNLSSYLSVLKAVAKQSRSYSDAGEICETIIKNMENRYIEGKSSVKPVIACYNCWIDVFSKSASNDSAVSALKIIKRVTELPSDLDLEPDVISFTTAMNAISKSNDASAPDIANDLLDQMISLGITPNNYTYNSFMSSFPYFHVEFSYQYAY